MTMFSTLSKDGRFKVTSDDMNPRIYCEEHKCDKCKAWFDADVMTFNEDGNQFCIDCVQQEEE